MAKTLETILTCALIGVGFAGLLGFMNTNGILVDEYITATLTITDLQTVVILAWVFVGVIVGVVRR
jgi:hypothetical protein